jgi:outer membrane protein TolC
MAAYIPLGFMVPGTAGEFMNTLPIVVSIALIVSIIIAVFLVPYLNFVFIKTGLINKNPRKQRRTFLDLLQGWFDISLEKAFRYPKTVIFTGAVSVGLAIFLFMGLDQQLFPEMERNQFAVEVYLTPGASIESTAEIVDSVEHLLMKDKRVTNVTSFIGTSSPRFQVAYAPNMPSSNYGQLLVNTISNEATREIVGDYAPKYSDSFANAHVKWKILAMQLNKAPVEVRISSDSIKDIRSVEEQVNLILKKTKHIAWVRTDWDQMQQNIKVDLDRDRANRMGYYKSLVSTSIMVGLDGLPLTTLWENDYPVEVRLSQESFGNKSIKTLEDLYVSSPINFTSVPLRSFAQFSPEWTEGTIVRRNGTRTLTILIDNDPQGVASNIFTEISGQIEKLKLPEGTTISYGGDYEGQVEVFVPMGIALGLSIVLIFFILLFQFKKTNLSLLIMSTMLFSLPGAVIGLIIMGYPFSITAFIGITSLCGMVVRNGIILIDYARQLRNKANIPVREAAIAAGKRRMRPIFLTSAAASVGVIPMILSRSPLWGPLGTVICFGLMFSMVLTLYILPVIYSLMFGDRAKKSNFRAAPAATAVIIAVMVVSLFSNSAKAQTLSLDSCKSLALLNNHKIKEAAFDVAQSKQLKKEAFTNYFPKVNAGAFAFKAADYLLKAKIPEMNLPVYDGNPVNLLHPTQFAYVPSIPINILDYMNVATIMATQPIFTGGQIINGNRLAKIGYEINREKQNMTSTDVLVRTEELYWSVIALREKTKTLGSYRMFLDTLQRDVSVAHKAGLVQRNDLLKVELKRNEIEVNALKLRNGIDLMQRALCLQIGIVYDSSLTLIDPHTAPVLPQQFYTQPEAAVSNRSEIKMLNQAIVAEELQKKMTLGSNLPTAAIGVTGFYFDAMNNANTNALAFATVSIPISDWWGGVHKMKQNQIRVESARNKLAETSELLTLQIEQANNELNEYYFQVAIAGKSVEQARENLKVTNDNYKAGISSMSDLLEAQSVYQDALDSLTEARCNYQVKKAGYMVATGRYNQ